MSEAMTADEARELIRKGGLRATPGRIAVLQVIAASSGPESHAAIVEQVTQAGTDASTVFRALNDMATAGLLRRMDLGDHVWRYEMATQHRDSDVAHPHFLCTDCGDIVCLEPIEIKESRRNNQKLKDIGTVNEVLLKGQCSSCQDET